MNIIFGDDTFCTSSAGVWPTYIKWQLKREYLEYYTKIKNCGYTCLLRINQRCHCDPYDLILYHLYQVHALPLLYKSRRDPDHKGSLITSRSEGVLDTTVCDNFRHCLADGSDGCFMLSSVLLVFLITNKSNHYNIVTIGFTMKLAIPYSIYIYFDSI